MNETSSAEYAAGPTACMARPQVVRSIHRQIKEARALSLADIRLARNMGLIAADVSRPVGFNDGVVYPPTETPAPAAGLSASPTRSAARASARGRLHALALLVDFPDHPGTRPPAEFQKLLFDAGNPGSLTSYYAGVSGGALTVTGEAVGYVRAPKPSPYYANGASGTGDTFPANTPGLLADALAAFCTRDTLARFDADGDGFVDGLFLVHAGGGAEAEPDPGRRANMIWSHKWTLPHPFADHGVKVFAYSTAPEDGRVGVFCHEFGHVLGLPDLYDTSYRSSGVGQWCLMGGGSWLGSPAGSRPGRLGCWCLARLGWVAPTVVRRTAELTLPTLAHDPAACYRVWTGGRDGPEYFLLENRQPVAQDAGLPGGGLAVWHVDERQSGNTNPFAYQVGLVQADGKKELERNVNQGNAGDLFPGAAAVTELGVAQTTANDGTPTGVALAAIREADGVVTVRVEV